MNVLIINSSPRKDGNSDILCKEFARGAFEAGNSIEAINLREKRINFCKACYACFRTGKCFQDDDMDEILSEIQMADVLVLASPTYFLTMNGQMKTMIDRLLPKWQDIGDKDVYIIVTGHDSREGLKRTADDLCDIFQGLGCRICGIIWGENVWEKGEILGSETMKTALSLGYGIHS